MIPLKHGIDRLGQLGAARLIDAARVNPDILPALTRRQGTASFDLGKSGHFVTIAALHVLERYLFLSPCVREDSIWGNIVEELRQAELAIVVVF